MQVNWFLLIFCWKNSDFGLFRVCFYTTNAPDFSISGKTAPASGLITVRTYVYYLFLDRYFMPQINHNAINKAKPVVTEKNNNSLKHFSWNVAIWVSTISSWTGQSSKNSQFGLGRNVLLSDLNVSSG